MYEVHLQNMRFTIRHFIRGPVVGWEDHFALYRISLRWETDAVFCNKLLYCIHVALADLKASTPVAVVVKEKQNHF